MIDIRCIYTKEEFLKQAGLSESAFRSMKRAGLKVRPIGKRVYIIGTDFLEFLNSFGGQSCDKPTK